MEWMLGWINKLCIAVSLCTPFTQWTFSVMHSDGAGWAERYPDEVGCARKMNLWKNSSMLLDNWQRPRPGDKAECVSPPRD